jgi:hypothetical protein
VTVPGDRRGLNNVEGWLVADRLDDMTDANVERSSKNLLRAAAARK